MKGALLYIRVSTAEQATNNNSLPAQEAKVKAFCDKEHLPVVKLFADKGESARTDDRPEFKKMLTYCRQHRDDVSHVIVADLSRLARNVLDQGQTIVELTELGIQLVSVDEPSLDDSAAGRLLKNVLGSMNQFFSDSLSEKTKFRMDAGVKQGRWLWIAPIGYLNETKTKTIVIDPERASFIAKAFELLATGIPIENVIRQVTALGLVTRKGRPIPKQTFSRMMRNPFYAGWIEKGGTRIKGTHEPLISDAVFDAVQERLTTKSPHEIESDTFPLRGFVRCAKCGKNLTAGWCTGRSKKYARYWCWTKGCGDVRVRAEYLENQFGNLLSLIQPEAHLLAMLPTLAARSWESRKERIASDSKSLVRRLEDQKTLNQKAIKAKLMNELSEEDFQTMKSSIETETKRIQEQIKALDSERSTMQELMKETERAVINFGESWKAASPARKREIQSALFPDRLGYDSELHYFCPPNQSLIELLTDIFESFKTLASPTGFEPVLPP